MMTSPPLVAVSSRPMTLHSMHMYPYLSDAYYNHRRTVQYWKLELVKPVLPVDSHLVQLYYKYQVVQYKY